MPAPNPDTAVERPPSEIDVSVCICTYRRAHVAETIRSVLAQQDAGAFEIVVVDDDPQHSAEPLVLAAAKDASLPVRYVFCGSRNIAAARNACLAAARGAWIAFIDDDETADPAWLRTLLKVQAEAGADVVKGFVRGVYPAGTPDWVRRGDPCTRDYGADGAPVVTIATGNVLFSRAAIEKQRLRFNPHYGRSGGEDSDFFRRLRAQGVKIVASRSAAVNEIVPEQRVTVAYLRSWNRRMGRTEGGKLRRGEGNFSGPVAAAIAVKALALGALHPLLRAAGSTAAYASFRKLWYGIGLIEGVLGLDAEYDD